MHRKHPALKAVSLVSFILVLVGALNWLLVGVSRFDLVRWITGRNGWLRRLIYDFVGAAAITQLTNFIGRTVRGKAHMIPG